MGELATINRGVRVTRDMLSEKGIPVYQNALTPLGYYSKSNRKGYKTFVICAGAAGKIGFSDCDFWAADDCYTFDDLHDVSDKFIYYCLQSKQTYIDSQVRRGSIPRISRDVFANIKIPVPPIALQERIVKTLDNFDKICSDLSIGLPAEISLRKKQYEYYRDRILSFNTNVNNSIHGGNLHDEIKLLQYVFGYAMVRLGDIATVTKLAGFEFTNYVTYSDKGKVIALRGLNVKDGKLVLNDVKYIDGSDFSKLSRSKLCIGDMLFTYVGTVGQVALIDENDKYYLAPNVSMIRLQSENVLPKFMMYYFKTKSFWNEQISKLLQQSSMQNIPMEKIRKFSLPIPSLSEQERIVAILDKFDALVNDLSQGIPAEIEARKKQYEYYRDKLLSFKEKS